ncbi:flap endonuclease GEN isoform X2 [Pectinophora gossypiella]|nr:flap endonuclease GEN isoform X2 [Pectinophora gossypiella]XP_049887230.1 flap endonuclease GEN isoform X2 [Pectinophora gossypiella]XP_049887231.1 flap endonuclease GEN isoform X2 [Pectinophora gossypiella]
MAARNAIQFRGAAPRSENATKKRPDVGRKRFKGVLKECESLLKCMGVRCVKGSGEAEATCAQLNAQGLVDAVVSQDSDCFAYGARRVYRNFSVSHAAGGGAMAGSVDCYDADSMFRSNGFGRNKMVALALLCGCDYGVGACGSSVTTAVSFLHTIADTDAIPRLLSWVSEPAHYEERSRWAAAPGRCDRCGHVGRTHAKKGCPVCNTHHGCSDLGHKAKVAEVKRELSLRSRALSCGMPFPEPKVMKEFLKTTPEKIDLESLKTSTPSLIQFVKIMSNKLDWSERYCVEKFLPLLTKWHLQDYVPVRTIRPTRIKKKRNPRGVPSYEVVWDDIDGQYEALIPDDQFEDGEDRTLPWTSTERQDLMKQYYPQLVESYEESVKKPAKEKKTRGRKKKDGETDKPKRKYTKKVKNSDVVVANLSTSMKHLNISTNVPDVNISKANVSVSVNKLKRKLKSKKGQRTIDSFIVNKRRKSSKTSIQSLKHSFKNVTLNFDDPEPKYLDKEYNKESQHLLSTLDTSEGDINERDLSDIVDRIVTSAPVTKTAKVDNNLYKLVFEKYSTPKKTVRKSVLREIYYNCSTPRESPIRRGSLKLCANVSNNSITCKVNTSYFFDKLTEDRDAFELSMEYKHKSAVVISLDCDATVDYSLPDVRL